MNELEILINILLHSEDVEKDLKEVNIDRIDVDSFLEELRRLNSTIGISSKDIGKLLKNFSTVRSPKEILDALSKDDKTLKTLSDV